MTRDRAARIYRALLRLAPARLRRDHAGEMETLFLERLAAARGAGRIPACAAWLSAVVDILSARGRRALVTASSPPDVFQERYMVMTGTDLKYTWRWLARQRFSTALVVAMLTLAIAANIVVFSLVNGLFLRPFPFPDPDRLVYINETAPRWNLEFVGINYPDFHVWHRDARLFEALAMFETRAFNLADDGGAERLEGAAVTADFAAVLGIRPIAGRMFTREEDRRGAARVVVLGERVWRERFGGNAGVIGQTMKLDGVPHEIVGVMPRTAEFPGASRLWVPLAGDPHQAGESYSGEGIGRLRPGVTVDSADKDLRRAHEPVWTARDKERTVSPFARPLREVFVRDFRASARLLLAAVTVLLVVACANVASVMLARALARRREMGIRIAVGASRGRLVRQLLLENLLLAGAGGAAGLLLGRAALAALIARAGDQVPRWTSFDLDPRVLAFSVVLIAAATLLFGWAPALHALRGNVRAAIHDASGAATSGARGRRTLNLLVTAEFALAIVLVIASGLLVRAYQRVSSVDPGFRVDHVLTFSIALPEAAYPDANARRTFWQRLDERLSAAPGVVAAGFVSCRPLGCHWGNFYRAEGAPPLAPGQSNPVVLFRPASPGYFRAMGIRLKGGRFFEPHDGRDDRRVAVVNETFARTFWSGSTDVVGRRFRGMGADSPWITVVGVVGDVQHYGLEQPMRPGIYFPLPGRPPAAVDVVIHTAGGDPAAFAATARALVGELDPELPLFGVRTMEEAIARSLAQRALYSWLIGVFASIALALALGGAYGVATYLASQRTREIGIRVALGATRRDIVRTVLRRALIPIGTGALLGAATAAAAGRVMGALLFGVSPRDPQVFGAAVGILLVLSVLIVLLPARRAARVDPMQVLRIE